MLYLYFVTKSDMNCVENWFDCMKLLVIMIQFMLYWCMLYSMAQLAHSGPVSTVAQLVLGGLVKTRWSIKYTVAQIVHHRYQAIENNNT